MVIDWGKLDDSEADELNELFEENFESYLSGDSKALQSCLQNLKSLLDVESDYFEEILEELPEETPTSFVKAVLDFGDDEDDFVVNVLSVLPKYLKIDDSDLRRMMTLTEEPHAGGDEFIDSQCGRATVAINVHTSEDLLLELAGDKRWEIRFRVALHPKITREIALQIIESKEYDGIPELESDVLTGLATNPNLDLQTLELLANHPERVVRTAVKLNPSTPDNLKKLTEELGTDAELPSTRLSWWEWLKPNNEQN